MNERGVLVCVRNHAYDPDPASAPVASGRPLARTQRSERRRERSVPGSERFVRKPRGSERGAVVCS